MKDYYEKELRQKLILREYFIAMACRELDDISDRVAQQKITPEEFQLTLSDLADIADDLNKDIASTEKRLAEAVAKEVTK